MEHKLEIKYRGAGFTAKCTCGKRMGGVRGANRAGMNYAQLYSWQAYKAHCKDIGQKPVMHPHCEGLAGVSVD